MASLIPNFDVYDSDSGLGTDDDGELCDGVTPSHDLQSKKHDTVISNVETEDDDEEEDSIFASQKQQQDELMAARNEAIRRRKLKRRGIVDDDEEDDFDPKVRSTLNEHKVRFLRLASQDDSTPSRQKSKSLLPDSVEESEENDDVAEDEDEGDSQLVTPRRVYNTNWVEVKRWSKDETQKAQINREIDGILEHSLKNAGYRKEHVAKTKDSDRSYWKEAHVIFLLFLLCISSICNFSLLESSNFRF